MNVLLSDKQQKKVWASEDKDGIEFADHPSLKGILRVAFFKNKTLYRITY